MDMDTHGDEVHTVGPKGAAAQQAAGPQGQTPPETVDGEGLDRVRGAARVKAARRDPARGRALIGGDQGDRRPDGAAAGVEVVAHTGSLSRPAFMSAVATSSRNTGGGRAAAPGSSRTRHVPRGRVGAAARTTSRARRRSEFRTTPPPQSRPMAYATWGNTPRSPGGAGTKVARTGPQAPRARERCSS